MRVHSIAAKVLTRPLILIVLLAMGLSGYKLYLLESNSRAIFGCQWCLTGSALIHEMQFWILVVLLHLVSVGRHRVFRGLCGVLIVSTMLITAIDLVVLDQFLMRLTSHELMKYFGEASAVFDYLGQSFTHDWKAFGVLSLVLTGITVLTQYFRANAVVAPSHPALILLSCALLFGLEKMESVEFHLAYTSNSLEAFFKPESRHRPYSKEFIASLSRTEEDSRHCFEGLGARPNLMMVIVESLSMYHSQEFSGLQDWMPQLDKASKDGIQFRYFYANGVSTEDGLIALFTGQPPIPRGVEKGGTVFSQLQGGEALPEMLNSFGYQTAFLTTGNLSFLQKGKWLREIGFHWVEGHDAPFYSGMERFHFGAAADEALYARGLEVLDTSQNTPLFMALESVSTHHPFVDPQSGVHSEEKVFRYADRQLGRLIRSLEEREYFRDGYLIIVSDHRAMIPMKRKESELYGTEGFARVPLVILGGGLEAEMMIPFSQTDLLPSLRHWLGEGGQCVDRNQGIFLPSVIHEPNCIYTRRSYNADNLYIHCGADEYIVRLDGDETRYVDGPDGGDQLLLQVHRLRLGLGY